MIKDNELSKISIIDPVGGHGGMDYYDYGLGYGLGANKLNVLYFTCNNTTFRDFLNVSLYKSFGNVWKANRFQRAYYFIKGYLSSFFISKKKKSEVLHFHFFHFNFLNLIVLFLASFFNQKKIVTLHDINPFHGNVNKYFEKISMKFIDGIIVHNEASMNMLLKKDLKLPKMAIIPHGNYLPFVTMLPENTSDKLINLLFFGQIKDVKGLDVLLKAMQIVVRQNSNYKLTIAGRPFKTDIGLYEKMIKDFGLNNFVEQHFRFIEDEEVSYFYKKADVVILPYKRIYQSGVLLLTLSYGKTVITSDLDPFKEIIVHKENGFIFESENADDLANCILKLNHTNILEASLNSKKIITDKFDWVKIGQKTKVFYELV